MQQALIVMAGVLLFIATINLVSVVLDENKEKDE